MTINRGIPKSSQYTFNAETGMLEKLEDNQQTIESISNQINKQINNLEDIGLTVNKQETNVPVNNIVVITADDNLIHNYFYDVDVSWDASNCLSSAIIKMPKMDTENTNYWTTYTGQLTIYAGYNFTFDYVNSNKYENEQDAANSLSKYWDNSDIQPFFRGEISRVKEYENDIKIYVDSIGRRFQQKIPDEFRQAFINNQNVRDAFQAICEFLGVKFICPPKTMTDDGEEVSEEESTGDGTENDVTSQKATENKIASQVKKKVKDANKNKAKSSSNNSSASDSSKSTSEGESTDNETEELTDNTEVEEGPQNGYGDINFDANGAIVHGSTVIETSPDMEDTLLAMDENPLEKYLEDETGIIESVQKLLNGDMFDELHNKVMNYDAITIEPKSSASSDIINTGNGSTGENSNETGLDATAAASMSNKSSNNASNNNKARSSPPKNGWYNGQLYENYKIKLYTSYINTLSKSEAAAKAKQTSIYTPETISNLKARAKGLKLK